MNSVLLGAQVPTCAGAKMPVSFPTGVGIEDPSRRPIRDAKCAPRSPTGSGQAGQVVSWHYQGATERAKDSTYSYRCEDLGERFRFAVSQGWNCYCRTWLALVQAAPVRSTWITAV
jgi:hypothetical protein